MDKHDFIFSKFKTSIWIAPGITNLHPKCDHHSKLSKTLFIFNAGIESAFLSGLLQRIASHSNETVTDPKLVHKIGDDPIKK